jgi:hypothetical protein
MSVVRASISRSSWDRSENPGRTCLACSLSRVATAQVSSESRNGESEAHPWPVSRQGFREPDRCNLPCRPVSDVGQRRGEWKDRPLGGKEHVEGEVGGGGDEAVVLVVVGVCVAGKGRGSPGVAIGEEEASARAGGGLGEGRHGGGTLKSLFGRVWADLR